MHYFDVVRPGHVSTLFWLVEACLLRRENHVHLAHHPLKSLQMVSQVTTRLWPSRKVLFWQTYGFTVLKYFEFFTLSRFAFIVYFVLVCISKAFLTDINLFSNLDFPTDYLLTFFSRKGNLVLMIDITKWYFIMEFHKSSPHRERYFSSCA